MITIRHNIDPSKFKWLWAKYVNAGNIEKHCTACLIGPYSKKFSGATNKEMLSQPVITMDEVPEGKYQAIYFCGVLKKGYLNKNPEKNNYRHNVHFAIVPSEGTTDVWNFEEWHVEIENGKLEHIPATYELSEEFFKAPYDAHYYTCRIFRWMVGHFYPEKLRDICGPLPKHIVDVSNGDEINVAEVLLQIIENGFNIAEMYFKEDGEDSLFNAIIEDDENLHKLYEKSRLSVRSFLLANDLFNRKEFAELVIECASGGGADLINFMHCMTYNDNGNIKHLDNGGDVLFRYVELGVEEYLDTLFPYQPRKPICVDNVQEKNLYY